MKDKQRQLFKTIGFAVFCKQKPICPATDWMPLLLMHIVVRKHVDLAHVVHHIIQKSNTEQQSSAEEGDGPGVYSSSR